MLHGQGDVPRFRGLCGSAPGLRAPWQYHEVMIMGHTLTQKQKTSRAAPAIIDHFMSEGMGCYICKSMWGARDAKQESTAVSRFPTKRFPERLTSAKESGTKHSQRVRSIDPNSKQRMDQGRLRPTSEAGRRGTYRLPSSRDLSSDAVTVSEPETDLYHRTLPGVLRESGGEEDDAPLAYQHPSKCPVVYGRRSHPHDRCIRTSSNVADAHTSGAENALPESGCQATNHQRYRSEHAENPWKRTVWRQMALPGMGSRDAASNPGILRLSRRTHRQCAREGAESGDPERDHDLCEIRMETRSDAGNCSRQHAQGYRRSSRHTGKPCNSSHQPPERGEDLHPSWCTSLNCDGCSRSHVRISDLAIRRYEYRGHVRESTSGDSLLAKHTIQDDRRALSGDAPSCINLKVSTSPKRAPYYSSPERREAIIPFSETVDSQSYWWARRDLNS